jgi:beta-N-acetylhexosaminidase
MDAELVEFMDDFNPGGVVLFSRNIEDPVALAELNRDLQAAAAKRSGEGIFIAVDQEGGRVQRLRAPFTEFPPALTLASSSDPGAAVSDFAAKTAAEIRLCGFNLNFAPVMDVVAQSEGLGDSVIGDRAFGSEPETVGRLGRIVIDQMRRGGVIPCAKHFPGHGGTRVDSHNELPVDGRDFDALDRIDLPPFREAVAAGVEMIMTAHLRYPALDSRFPATLSYAVISGVLRRRMGFDRLVVTDDLDMRAIADRYSPREYAVLAVSAGVDLLLICHDWDRAFQARSALYAAVKDGELTTERLAESWTRISDLKREFAGSMKPCDPERLREYLAQKRQPEELQTI